MNLDSRYPSIPYLERAAKRRLPHFVWEFLHSGTGTDSTRIRNRNALDEVKFVQSALAGPFTPDLKTTFLGRDYPIPLGIAPVGMSGLMWPDAERILSRFAAQAGLPYCLSAVAAQAPEDLKDTVGEQGWFQLYCVKDPAMRRDILKRAKDAGFHTLIVTLDVPAGSRRERQRVSGLTQPPRITPRIFAQCAIRPDWSLRMALRGMPRLKLMESYQKSTSHSSPTEHVGYQLRTSPDQKYWEETLAEWDGPVIAKGVMRPDAAQRLKNLGADAVWVSNHGGRQLDGSPGSIEVLPEIREAVGHDYPLIFDSGVESGLDVLRALAMGANFVMMGRGFHYALSALRNAGPQHLVHVLTEDMKSVMSQIGCKSIDEVGNALWHG